MSGNIFIPRTQVSPKTTERPENHPAADGIQKSLLRIVRTILWLAVGLLPLVFMPGLPVMLGFSKAVFVLIGVVLSAIGLSFLMLRSSRLVVPRPLPLLFFFGFGIVAIVSSWLSLDLRDSIGGNAFEVHTTGFFLLLLALMVLMLVWQGASRWLKRLLLLLSLSSIVLLGYNLLHVFIGGDALSLGSFQNATFSPVGNLNDLAIFSGLVVIIGLLSLLQLRLSRSLQLGVGGVVFLAVLALALANFFTTWLVVGFFSLLITIYLLAGSRLFTVSDQQLPHRSIPLAVAALVCVVCGAFIIAGQPLGQMLNPWTKINFVEVRPSLEATIDIAKATYREHAWFGVGPNRFADAWRLHKDEAINSTIFWNTDFAAGYGYIPTLFVTTGLIGGLLMVLFHLSYLFFGYRLLLRPVSEGRFWHYAAAASFTAAVYLWGMSYVYVPSATLLLLAAACTGISFATVSKLDPESLLAVPLANNQSRAFMLVGITLIVVIFGVGTLLTVTKQYAAQAIFVRATDASLAAEVDQAMVRALALYKNDVYYRVRSQYELQTIASIINTAEPTEENQQRFLDATRRAIEYAESAILIDGSDPANHVSIAGIYNNLAIAGVDGAFLNADAALKKAVALDPKNPNYPLIAAERAVQIGDIEAARKEIESALALKRNFSEALFLAAQLDISEGKTADAITKTRSIITLEPNNPTRYFQLGVLLSADKQYDAAIEAYKTALSLDQNYANARYLLAQVYLLQNNTEAALSELKRVEETNHDNSELLNLIRTLEAGGTIEIVGEGFAPSINGAEPTEPTESGVTTPVSPDTDLVSPINQVVAPETRTETFTLPEATE
ncbi:MAG: tetratricopeptide repeat protein [Patescibacteria group bacterium]